MSQAALNSLIRMAPVARKSAAEMVVEKLLELIYSGSVKAGDTLPTEQELSAALQVSRPVIREALRGLQILGVVETRQGGRCSVTDLKPSRLAAPLQFLVGLDHDNVEALYEARLTVEGELLALGAARADETALEHLEHMVHEGHRLTTDPLAFRVMDLEFHHTLMRLAGNPFLERTAQSLYHIGAEVRRVASETPGVLTNSAREHELILDALKLRDPERARRAMHTHLASILRTTREAMQQPP